MNELIYREEPYRIMGACFDAHKENGCGFSDVGASLLAWIGTGIASKLAPTSESPCFVVYP